jgi:hypothetical protein
VNSSAGSRGIPFYPLPCPTFMVLGDHKPILIFGTFDYENASLGHYATFVSDSPAISSLVKRQNLFQSIPRPRIRYPSCAIGQGRFLTLLLSGIILIPLYV